MVAEQVLSISCDRNKLTAFPLLPGIEQQIGRANDTRFDTVERFNLKLE